MINTKRDLLTDETWLRWNADYESLREFRNSVSKRRPTEEELLHLTINKPWERFYEAMLW